MARLGQNFLADPNLLAAIVREAGPDPGDVVLEVGGGEGALTAVLAPRVATLHVIELDGRLRASPALERIAARTRADRLPAQEDEQEDQDDRYGSWAQATLLLPQDPTGAGSRPRSTLTAGEIKAPNSSSESAGRDPRRRRPQTARSRIAPPVLFPVR